MQRPHKEAVGVVGGAKYGSGVNTGGRGDGNRVPRVAETGNGEWDA
jgi:hypothetical protein